MRPVLQVRRDLPALQDRPAQPAQQAQPALLVNRAKRDLLVLLVQLVQQAQQAPRVPLDLPDPQDQAEAPDHLDTRDPPDLQDQAAAPDLKDIRDLWVQPAPQDHKEYKAAAVWFCL